MFTCKVKAVTFHFLLSLFAVSSALAAPTLTGESVSGQAGTTFKLPIAFNPGSASVSSLQFNLTLPSGVSAGTVTPGSIVTSAGKNVSTSLKGNTWSFVIFGINQNAISSGNLLTAEVTLSPRASGTLSLPFSNVAYSDPRGRSISAGASTGPKAITLAAANLNNMKIYPNPWRKDKHDGTSITFDNLPPDSTVKIFTVSNHWVKTLSPALNTVSWDLTNDKGEKVAAGVYLYLLTAGGQKKTGQFAIIK